MELGANLEILAHDELTFILHESQVLKKSMSRADELEHLLLILLELTYGKLVPGDEVLDLLMSFHGFHLAFVLLLDEFDPILLIRIVDYHLLDLLQEG